MHLPVVVLFTVLAVSTVAAFAAAVQNNKTLRERGQKTFEILVIQIKTYKLFVAEIVKTFNSE